MASHELPVTQELDHKFTQSTAGIAEVNPTEPVEAQPTNWDKIKKVAVIVGGAAVGLAVLHYLKIFPTQGPNP